jgi:hypothetical protein
LQEVVAKDSQLQNLKEDKAKVNISFREVLFFFLSPLLQIFLPNPNRDLSGNTLILEDTIGAYRGFVYPLVSVDASQSKLEQMSVVIQYRTIFAEAPMLFLKQK